MKIITCKLPEELAARLDAMAQEERRSRSAVLREALEDRLRAKSRQPVRAADLVRHLCGSVDRGLPDVTDLATNPEHLRGFGE